jgi:hypothetical protein
MAAPQTFDELLSRLADATLRVSGADHSSARDDYLVDMTDGVSAAHLNGVVEYDDDAARSLRQLYEPDPDYEQALNGLWVGFRNHLQLCAPEGKEYWTDVPAMYDPTNPSSHADHQITDAFALQRLPALVRVLELEQRFRGIQAVADKHVVPDRLISPGTTGATALAGYIAFQSESMPDSVMTALNNETPGGSVPLAAEMLYNASLRNVPPERFAEAGVTPDRVRALFADTIDHHLRRVRQPAGPATTATARPDLGNPNWAAQAMAPPARAPLPPLQRSPGPQDVVSGIREVVDSWRVTLGVPIPVHDPAMVSPGAIRKPAGPAEARQAAGQQPHGRDGAQLS